MPTATNQLQDVVVMRGISAPSDPEISVVVMSTNADPHTLEAVRSVVAQGLPAEILVVNTGSGTLASSLAPVVDDIVLIETPSRQFAGGTRNLGIRHSTAPFIAFLAADCLASPGWLKKRLEAHRIGHHTVASALRPLDDGIVSWAAYAFMHPHRMPETPSADVFCLSLSYSREILDRMGGFDEQVRIGEDTLLNQLCGEIAPALWNPEILTLHRYPTSISEAVIDQFQRGRRSAAFSREIRKKWTLRPILAKIRRTAKTSLQVTRGLLHRNVLRSTPLMFPLLASYSLGALSCYVHRPQYSRSALEARTTHGAV